MILWLVFRPPTSGTYLTISDPENPFQNAHDFLGKPMTFIVALFAFYGSSGITHKIDSG